VEVSLYIGYLYLGAKMQVSTEMMNNSRVLTDQGRKVLGPEVGEIGPGNLHYMKNSSFGEILLPAKTDFLENF
jgi:hypothetical protein